MMLLQAVTVWCRPFSVSVGDYEACLTRLRHVKKMPSLNELYFALSVCQLQPISKFVPGLIAKSSALCSIIGISIGNRKTKSSFPIVQGMKHSSSVIDINYLIIRSILPASALSVESIQKKFLITMR